MVEHSAVNRVVVGSSPTGRVKNRKNIFCVETEKKQDVHKNPILLIWWN